jgi:hypothetical protein
MDILVKGIKATIAFIRPEPATTFPFHREDQISVWLDLEKPLPGGGTVGFGVYLPATHYSRESFLDALVKAADERATNIIERGQEDRERELQEKKRLADLQALISDLEKELAG